MSNVKHQMLTFWPMTIKNVYLHLVHEVLQIADQCQMISNIKSHILCCHFCIAFWKCPWHKCNLYSFESKKPVFQLLPFCTCWFHSTHPQMSHKSVYTKYNVQLKSYHQEWERFVERISLKLLHKQESGWVTGVLYEWVIEWVGVVGVRMG